MLLILFEAVGLMHTATRRLNWMFDVYALLALLVLVLPVAQVYHLLRDAGFSRGAGARGAFVAEAVFLYVFWRIGDPFKTGFADARALFSVEAAMGRILIVGTTMLALLSGFTAVNLPYGYLAWFLHRVSERDVLALEKRFFAALDDIAAEKRHVLETERAPGGVDVPTRRIHHVPDALIAAERRADAAFLRFNEAAAAWRDILFARTALGRLFTALGALMLLLCGVRVAVALANIWRHLRGGSAARGGAPKLFGYLHRALVPLGVHADKDVVYQYATLGFTSILIATNMRAALIRMSSAFTLLSDNESVSSSAPVFIAHLMGTYVISSTILVRSFLPPGTRALISDVMGSMEFQYFQNWFDILFIGSAAIAVLFLTYQSGRLKRIRPSRGSAFMIRQNGWSTKMAND